MFTFPVTLYSGFNPKAIPDLALWLDAADASTITQSAGAVSQWNDKSVNGYNATQGTGANQPTTGAATVNGKNVLTFNGTSSFMALPAGAGSTFPNGAATIFTAVKSTNTTTNSDFFVYIASAAGSKRSQVGIRPGLSAVCKVENATGSGVTANVTGTPNTNEHILGFNYGGSTSITAFFDGNNTATAASQGTFSGAIQIGCFNGTSNFWPGSISEIILYTRSLSNAEMNLVGQYLAAKWGTTWTNL